MGCSSYFGWPTAHEDDPERAVRAGLAIVEAVARGPGAEVGPLAAVSASPPASPSSASSPARVTRGRRPWSGETPNLAARLQALAAPNTVVIGASTRRLVSGLFELADLGSHDLKGFAAPVPAWRVLGPSAAHGRFAARAAAGLTPLVGREPELALLLDRWAGARRGGVRSCWCRARPGIGKSRLLSALHQRLRHEAVHAAAVPMLAASSAERAVAGDRSARAQRRISPRMTTWRRSSPSSRHCSPRRCPTSHQWLRCWRPCWRSPPTAGIQLGTRARRAAGADAAGALPPPREHRGSAAGAGGARGCALERPDHARAVRPDRRPRRSTCRSCC